MQVRFSTCRGAELVEEPTGEVVGFVFKPLIEPDRGQVLGFFIVTVVPITEGKIAYVSAMDVLHIGSRIEIRDVQCICNPDDIVRLGPILQDARPVLGQRIRTESGLSLGRCVDIQFDTETMHVSWLFPRKWFRWQEAIPISTVLEVRKDAILVQDTQQPIKSDLTGDLRSNEVYNGLC